MTDVPSNEFPTPPLFNRFRLLLIVAAASLLFAWFLRELQPPRIPRSALTGQPFPEIVVEGWLNGPGPTAADLNGKVRVIEAWAYWCRPCLESTPHLVDLHERFQDRGVVFIGLTSEGYESLERSRQFLQQANISWPNGYGADPTFAVFYPDSGMAIPVLWVVDRQGKIAFHGHPAELSPEMLDELLK